MATDDHRWPLMASLIPSSGKTSCTLRLLRWCKRERLAARGIDLSIRIARVFRAAWTDESAHRDEVRGSIRSARLLRHARAHHSALSLSRL